MIRYEESELPEIAIAPDHFDVPIAMMWVRSHQEPLMMLEHDGHYMLIFIAANNSVQIESLAFRGATDASKAADMMRTWLRHQDLIDPEDLAVRLVPSRSAEAMMTQSPQYGGPRGLA